jgi:hypothetical protein
VCESVGTSSMIRLIRRTVVLTRLCIITDKTSDEGEKVEGVGVMKDKQLTLAKV